MWKIDASGRLYLDKGNTDLVAIQAERDAANAKLVAVQRAHDALLQQVAALEAAIAQAGMAITQAEPQP